jgi:hypothetical protein
VCFGSIPVVAAMVMFSSTTPGEIPMGKVFPLLFVISAASGLVGAFMGMLFGIPRTLTADQEEAQAEQRPSEVSSKSNNRKPRKEFRTNTNLELVSDWLTKILVGVGLTQFHALKDVLTGLSTYFSEGLTGVAGIQAMITAIIVIYVILGFLGGYLVTRLFLSRALIEAETGLDEGGATDTEKFQPQLGTAHLTEQEILILTNVINAFQQGSVSIIPKEWMTNSDQYQALIRLRERGLIQLHTPTDWESGKAIELTHEAQQHLERIQEEITTGQSDENENTRAQDNKQT